MFWGGESVVWAGGVGCLVFLRAGGGLSGIAGLWRSFCERSRKAAAAASAGQCRLRVLDVIVVDVDVLEPLSNFPGVCPVEASVAGVKACELNVVVEGGSPGLGLVGLDDV